MGCHLFFWHLDINLSSAQIKMTLHNISPGCVTSKLALTLESVKCLFRLFTHTQNLTEASC